MAKALIAGLLMASALLAACSSEKKSSREDNYFVRFVPIARDWPLSGEAQVHLEYSIPATVQSVEFGVEGHDLVGFDGPVPRFELDTRAYQDGEQTLVVHVRDHEGNDYTDRLRVQIDNPEQRFLGFKANRITHSRGDLVELDLQYSHPGLDVTASFAQMDSAFTADRVTLIEGTGGHYALKYSLSLENSLNDGTYPVTLKATSAAAQPEISTVWLRYRRAPAMPLLVADAVFSDLSEFNVRIVPTGPPHIESVTLPERIISGQPATLHLTWSQQPDRAAAYVAVRAKGHSGTYLSPVQGTEASLSVQLPSMPPEAARDPLFVEVLVLDALGETLGAVTQSTTPVPVPTGSVHVALAWDTPVDLDLEVITPSSNALNYVNRSVDGGTLDLDSNAMCTIDGANTESASWLYGYERSGTYYVHVSLYDLCGQESVNYRVFVTACGETQVHEGIFSRTDQDAGTTILEVASFEVDCAYHVGGRVTFETTSRGLPPTAPAIEVPVQVIGADGNAIASTKTRRDGTYFIPLGRTSPGEYTVRVSASWDVPGGENWGLKALRLDGTEPHLWSSARVDADVEMGHVQDFHISKEEGSGAFNILDILRQGREWMLAQDVIPVEPLLARWERHTPNWKNNSLCCAPTMTNCNSEWAVYINGAEDSIDEFDESVIAHEFMHYVIGTASRRGGGGGRHLFGERAAPSLAWNEGIATALGQDLLKLSIVRNIRVRGGTTVASLLDLEITDSEVTTDPAAKLVSKGTDSPSGNAMTGNLSEVLPAMLVWDLLDPATPPDADADSYDAIALGSGATFQTLFRYFPSSDWQDRGSDDVDLVDFLDGWTCYDAKTQALAGELPRNAELEAILEARNFAYDFGGPAQCPDD